MRIPTWEGIGRAAARSALALMAMAWVATAFGQEDAAGGDVVTGPPRQTVLWIQDPWTGESVLTTVEAPDQSLWDATQVKDYEQALQEDFPPPLGVLTIRKLGLQVPIFNGADDHTLDRGAGRIKGMAKPGEDGNFGVSAHRDSFFRVLKDIAPGDDVLVQTAHGVDRYVVKKIDIVPKEDASVLQVDDGKMLTLVTCYPFYYVGSAPQRFIVRAYATHFEPWTRDSLTRYAAGRSDLAALR